MDKVDLSDFDDANGTHYPKSKVELIMDELSGDRLESLRAALADRQYSSAAIARVLVGWGFDVSADSVQKWRKRNR
jgi:hypothetical protein